MDTRAMTTVDVGKRRFTDLWRRRVASPPSPDGAAVYAKLCRLYTAPYRRYHNLDHIEDCLPFFCIQRIVDLFTDIDTV